MTSSFADTRVADEIVVKFLGSFAGLVPPRAAESPIRAIFVSAAAATIRMKLVASMFDGGWSPLPHRDQLVACDFNFGTKPCHGGLDTFPHRAGGPSNRVVLRRERGVVCVELGQL